MFGLFKSKKDKEVDELTKTLNETREPLYLDDNVVEDLATDIMNRYKLTVSTIESISYPGLLTPDIENSGYVVIAVNENEFITVNYKRSYKKTRVYFGGNSLEMLNNIQESLEEFAKKEVKGAGISYRNTDWVHIVGAITTLGYRVGMEEADNGLYLPFNYKDNKFYIVDYDNKIWIVFEEKRKKEDMNYTGIAKEKNKTGEDNLLESIKKLDESEISSMRLNFKNIGEAFNTIEKMKIEQVTENDIMYIKFDDKIYGIYVVDNRYIHLTDFSDNEEIVDFQALQDAVKSRNEALKKKYGWD